MPPILDAAGEHATVGEISDCLRGVFGDIGGPAGRLRTRRRRQLKPQAVNWSIKKIFVASASGSVVCGGQR
jgi:hypothetical protein